MFEYMEKYNPKSIESKWQEYWAKYPELSQADEKSEKPKFYCLDMFPYPSGDGLHVGHVENYTATDIYSRYLRMNGKNVLHPVGWDAFGLPAENYAIKMGVHPRKKTQENIENFTRQIKSLGVSYDWSREIDTSSPEYYKWTQWFFLFLYKNGLAYRKKAKVNWCESCKTVLANEQVEDGRCERCKKEVIQKDLEQWFFKITDFAEDLIKDLDKVDWPHSTKIAQRNWIGKSEGAIIKFSLTGSQLPSEKYFEVFTTRVDTIYGCTYCVVAPENELVESLQGSIENYEEVEKYIAQAKKKTDLQRTELQKEKTGVEIKGIKAINPFTNEAVPIFVADYVLSTYGTGAVMAVPSHDERDWEFAKKYKLPIKQVIEPCFLQLVEPGKIREDKPFVEREAIMAVVRHWEKDAYLGLEWKQVGWKTFVTGGPEKGQTMEEAARNEILEETGYKNLKLVKKLPRVHGKFFHVPKQLNRFAHFTVFYFELENGEKQDISEKEKNMHDVVWVPKEKVEQFLTPDSHIYIWQGLLASLSPIINIPRNVLDIAAGAREGLYCESDNECFTDDGVLANSEKYSSLTSEKAREEMAGWLEKKNLGGRKTTYKLRDWLISRQRYWGAPIPMIFCEKCGWREVPEKDLPVLLPDVKDYRPKGTSPLGTNLDFVCATCPECGGAAKRETDTMDTFVCSSWYFFRFADPKNEKEFAAKKQIEKWLPVDMYMGGAEHTVLHLMYSRFFTKSLYRHKLIDFDEPFAKLRHQGMVLAEDGKKMSKSLGNVINPDEIVREYGADTLRLYEMFMGPLEEMKAWNTKSIVGLKRFLDRVWRLSEKLKSKSEKPQLKNKSLESLVQKTIKKVTEDIENFRFNTAISAMMILLNEFEKEIYLIHYTLYIILLSPFAPHIAEELWSELGHKNSIFLEKWPEYDKKLIKDEEITLIIQVNGKVRDQLKLAAGASEEEAKKLALESEKVAKYIGDKEPRKIIFVPNRLINFVV
jgi:leucyl-tRNA synthetase